ncbi:ABC transporter permease subunit [Halomarina salina]|uniref:ABC transporter permease subunit n=1 Tax=Halomarina salina TaxID=1872699 RepID=A0ABD5RKS8_9EURY|nr:ABC transporter permease subunit [Halomarina salina]
MLETARYDAERRLSGSVVLALGLSAYAALMILMAPSLLGDIDLAALVEQYPPQLVEAFNLELIGTIEGYLALELYQFAWVLGLGAYLAYSAAGSVAGDVDDGRMDTILAAPVSRGQVVVEKFLSLLVPVVVVNVVVLAVVALGTSLVDYPVPAADLVAVHALSIPYLLFCGGLGMLASVVAPRRFVAEGVAVGLLVGTFLLDSVTAGTDLDWLSAVAPMRYYDPVAILTASEYDLVGAVVLLGVAVALLAASGVWFRRVDVR